MRSYNTESLLGSFACDVLRELTGAEVTFMNAGGLRADLPQGAITVGHVQDAFPFLNSVVILELTGAQIREVLEQGFTLKRGMIQVSGLVAQYDLSRPEGHRLVTLSIGGKPVVDGQLYPVATNSFLAEGGDLYETFTKAKWIEKIDKDVATAVIEYLRRQTRAVPSPEMGRLVPVK